MLHAKKKKHSKNNKNKHVINHIRDNTQASKQPNSVSNVATIAENLVEKTSALAATALNAAAYPARFLPSWGAPSKATTMRTFITVLVSSCLSSQAAATPTLNTTESEGIINTLVHTFQKSVDWTTTSSNLCSLSSSLVNYVCSPFAANYRGAIIKATAQIGSLNPINHADSYLNCLTSALTGDNFKAALDSLNLLATPPINCREATQSRPESIRLWEEQRLIGDVDAYLKCITDNLDINRLSAKIPLMACNITTELPSSIVALWETYGLSTDDCTKLTDKFLNITANSCAKPETDSSNLNPVAVAGIMFACLVVAYSCYLCCSANNKKNKNQSENNIELNSPAQTKSSRFN